MVYSVHSGGFSTIQAPTNNLSTIYNAKNFLLEPGNISPTAGITVGLVQLAGHSFALNGSGSDVDGTVTNLTLFQTRTSSSPPRARRRARRSARIFPAR